MQMKDAKLGKITEEMDKIIRKENEDREKLIKNIAHGKAVRL